MQRFVLGRWLAALGLAGLGALSQGAGAETKLDPITPRLAEADAARGEKVFLQCKACHVAAPGAAPTVGPNLWGVVGRPVASQSGFDYTEGLRAIGGDWDFETLSRYLFDPAAMAHNTRMVFAGVKSAQERADLIAYLATLSDTAVALPEPPEREGPAYGGLPAGEGREAVYFTCRACHALEQFTDRKKSRDQWQAIIEQMIAEKGMIAPEHWAREQMLSYLSTHFGQEEKRNWRGLPPGPGREEVYYTCTACHSIRMVTQQGLSRERWDETLEWMVEEQGMAEIEDPAVRDLILDYLATHYGGAG
ncbi:c-type cytochrome [Halochromatium roseum]|uniref:c-type cytochrome n=1 Tax=Halochromatium roseum TaxID=391920 RepID=UPI0019115420|nr:cytochrome c family protein [Halochromatium roseum]MBK5939113.1 hypothetical protein [Halochromatium roseum]